VESGAFFEGNCRHSDDPLGDNLANEEARKPTRPLAASSPSAPATPAAYFAPLSPAAT
jgi:hypothetical protein